MSGLEEPAGDFPGLETPEGRNDFVAEEFRRVYLKGCYATMGSAVEGIERMITAVMVGELPGAVQPGLTLAKRALENTRRQLAAEYRVELGGEGPPPPHIPGAPRPPGKD